jgi:hypothetical protein
MNNIVSGTTTAISVLLGLVQQGKSKKKERWFCRMSSDFKWVAYFRRDVLATYNLLIKYYLNEIYANKSFIFIIKMLQFIH